MSNYKEKIIEWLIANEAVTHDIIQKSKLKIKDIDALFDEEAKQQEFEENKRLVINEISKSIGLTPDTFHGIVEDIELRKYFERFK